MMKNILILFVLVNLGLADYIRDDDKEVVIDTSTKLMWSDDTNSSTLTKTWEDAINYCEASTLGGYSDWRLPSFNELYMIADRSTYNPAINNIFTNVISSSHWSSTTLVSDTTYAWYVNFDDGNDGMGIKTSSSYVRCVRNAE